MWETQTERQYANINTGAAWAAIPPHGSDGFNGSCAGYSTSINLPVVVLD